MNNLLASIAIVLALAGIGLHFIPTEQKLGAATSGNTTNYTALTVDQGPLTVTTSNTATSTTALGCVQTTATSTATPIRIVIGSSGATTTYQGTSSNGVVGWQYGTCPI